MTETEHQGHPPPTRAAPPTATLGLVEATAWFPTSAVSMDAAATPLREPKVGRHVENRDRPVAELPGGFVPGSAQLGELQARQPEPGRIDLGRRR